MAVYDPGPMAVSIAACKAFLRLERDDEDAVLAGFVRTAMALCEAFTGQWLIVRDGEQRLAAMGGWQRLLARPVTAITALSDAAGPLAGGEYESDIDAAGSGWVRLSGQRTSVVTAVFRAGLAADWNGVPEPLRQGLIRLTAHLYTHRDAADAAAAPAAVAALWRPYRVMRLG